MTPFHLKLYYYLTEKNTGVGQNNVGYQFQQNFYGQKSKHKQASNISSIDMLGMPKKLLVITNQ